MRFAFTLAALLTAAAPSASAGPVTPAPVVAAERAFAADGYALGVKASFLKHAAPDGVVLQPGPVNAREAYGAQPDGSPDDPKLEWWPTFAGIARSGDLGFTTGPYSIAGQRRGHYFTVWKRQADGGWQWVFDGGAPSDPSAAPGPNSEPASLPVSTLPGRYPEGAFAEVQAAEAALATQALTDLKAAYLKVLADDAHVQGSPAAPAVGHAAHPAELDRRAPAMTLAPLGGEVSMAGDLAWTYGTANWTRDGQEGKGHYVRIWQRRAEGWRIVFDELLVQRPPPPAN